MKGQFLPVEFILTFGLGLIAATGLIIAFDSFSTGVYESSEAAQANAVISEVLTNVNSLRPVEGDAVKRFSLPDRLGNRDYTVAFDDGIVVSVGGSVYREPLSGGSFSGSGSGDVILRKSNDEYVLVDS